jgi:transposase-like protein
MSRPWAFSQRTLVVSSFEKYAYAFGSASCRIAASFQWIAPAMEAGMSYRKMSLLEFQRRFATEEACRDALEEARWPNGFVCPRCEGKKATRHGPRSLLRCSACRYQASVTAGTILHRTHIPLVKWFWAMWLVAQDKGGISALRLARQLELSYRAAWTLLHKLRKAMAARDAGYTLTGSIEMDDAFFGGPASGKRGRGAANKTKVVVMVENRQERAGFIGMTTVSRVSSAEIGAAAAKIAPGQEIRTDGHSAYRTLASLGHTHHAQPVPPDQARELLPWVRIAISNAKTFLLGTYHGVSHKYLQTCLDEFRYRFNRRAWEPTLTERLITACSAAKPLTLAELRA